MFAITVTEKGGEQRRLDFDKPEITIGRVQGNDVILPKGNVSKRHARIVLKDGKFIIVDLKSTNGTYVNGRKITSPLVVKESDKIYIGDFILGVEENVGRATEMGSRSQIEPPMPPAMSNTMGGIGSTMAGSTEPPPLGDSMPAREPPMREPPMREPPMREPPMREAPMAMREPPMREAPMPRPMAPLPPPVAPPLLDHSSMPGSSPSQPSLPPSAPFAGAAPPPAGMRPPRTAPPRPAPGSVPPPIAAASSPVAPAQVAPVPAPSRVAAPAPAVATPVSAASRPRLVGAGAQVSRGVRPQAAQLGRRGPVVQPLEPKVVKMLELQAQILERLVPKLDLDDVPLERLGDEDLWQRAESAIVDLVETMDSSGELPKFLDQDQLIKETLNEALGLGPLEDLLADEKVEEIIVDRRDRILVGKAGQMTGAPTAFSSDASFRRVVERLVAPTGHKIDQAHPLVDVRLRDGSRLAAAVPPVAVRGACLTLRKPKASSYSLADLIGQRALSGEMADFLTTCVAARKNLVVCGAPGSGKSAVLAALAGSSSEGERIVSVEEVAELALSREDWIALESRPSDGNGVSAVDIGTLLRGALRMRPDRLVVGDVRGGEALELLQAMASSSDGTLASVAGEGARGGLARLAGMARMAAPGVSIEALRELVACAVDVVVHVARYADGIYRIASIDEVIGATDTGFQTQTLFSFRGTTDEGGFTAAGVIPSFYAELEARGMPADTTIFRS